MCASPKSGLTVPCQDHRRDLGLTINSWQHKGQTKSNQSNEIEGDPYSTWGCKAQFCSALLLASGASFLLCPMNQTSRSMSVVAEASQPVMKHVWRFFQVQGFCSWRFPVLLLSYSRLLFLCSGANRFERCSFKKQAWMAEASIDLANVMSLRPE